MSLRLAIDRLCPPRRNAPVEWPLPRILCRKDYAAAYTSVVQAVGSGQLTPAEAQQVCDLIDRLASVLREGDPIGWEYPIPPERLNRYRQARKDTKLAMELSEEMDESSSEKKAS
jgi:hypothetical protein